MKNSKFKYIFILHILLAVYSLGAIASKLASNEEFLSFKFIMLYGFVLFELFIYALVWQQLIKKLPLFTAFANKAVTVIWGILWGFLFFGEAITVTKVIGAIIVIAGVIFTVSEDSSEDNSVEGGDK